MDLDRETVVEIVAAIVPVLFLLGVLAAVGRTYSSDGSLTPTGGKVLVGAIVAFVVVLAVIGLVLSRSDEV